MVNSVEVTKIYFPEMGNMEEVSNRHALANSFLIISLQCIIKNAPIPFIMAVHIPYFVLRIYYVFCEN